MHNSDRDKTVTIERQKIVVSLWTHLCFLEQLCLSIAYILHSVIIGVRWKLQTLVHGEIIVPVRTTNEGENHEQAVQDPDNRKH